MNLISWLQAIMAETQGVAEEQPDSYNNLNPLEIDRQKTISWAFPFPEARIWEAGFESQRNVWPDFDDQCLDEMKGTHYRRPRRTGRDTCGRQIRHSGLFQIEGTHMLKADRARAALAVGFVGATSAGKSWLAGILNEGPGWYGRWPILGKHFFSARWASCKVMARLNQRDSRRALLEVWTCSPWLQTSTSTWTLPFPQNWDGQYGVIWVEWESFCQCMCHNYSAFSTIFPLLPRFTFSLWTHASLAARLTICTM